MTFDEALRQAARRKTRANSAVLAARARLVEAEEDYADASESFRLLAEPPA